MKTRIIDILNKMADGTLEDGFKFEYDGDIYTYFKENNEILENDVINVNLGDNVTIEQALTDEVEVIEEKEEILPIYRETYVVTQDIEIYTLNRLIRHCENKINELVEAVNKLKKEAE